MPPCAFTVASTIARPRPLPPRLAHARRIGVVEAIERLRRDVVGHAGPVVVHFEDRGVGGAVHTHAHRRAFRRVHERVAHEVAHDLTEATVVAQHGGAMVDRRGDLAVRIDRARVAHRVFGEHLQVNRGLFERAALVEAREKQQVVHQEAHADRFLLGAAHRLPQLVALLEPAGAVQLRVAPDRRHRRAQLVRRVADEPAEPVLRAACARRTPPRCGRASG